MKILERLKKCITADEVISELDKIDKDIIKHFKNTYDDNYPEFLSKEGEDFIEAYEYLVDHPLSEIIFKKISEKNIEFTVFEVAKDYDEYLLAKRLELSKEEASEDLIVKIKNLAKYFQGNNLELFCVYDHDMHLFAETMPESEIEAIFEDFFCITVKYNGTLLLTLKDAVNELYGFAGLDNKLVSINTDGVKKMISGSEEYYEPFEIKEYKFRQLS